jgi:hypothetical protein
MPAYREAHKKIEAIIVAVRYHAKDSLLALSQLGQLQIVLIGNILYLSQSERRETDCG